MVESSLIKTFTVYIWGQLTWFACALSDYEEFGKGVIEECVILGKGQNKSEAIDMFEVNYQLAEAIAIGSEQVDDEMFKKGALGEYFYS